MADELDRLQFPINRRHQGLATLTNADNHCSGTLKFPINRRHQGLATLASRSAVLGHRLVRFQSIGVTKDWRLGGVISSTLAGTSFQSIGVTKDWRLWNPPFYADDARRASFQSIGVTKDWRPAYPINIGLGPVVMVSNQ